MLNLLPSGPWGSRGAAVSGLAQAGASLLAVLAPDSRLVDQARKILASHGARRMRFYGDKAITDLS